LKDIGQLDVILETASNSWLDPTKLKSAFNESRYKDRLGAASIEAQRLDIQSVPAFVFENDEVFVGALTPESFRKTLENFQNGTYV
jgi:predicted DsbA family dithiol-disulfide isomerase